jgi:hypothetical protein
MARWGRASGSGAKADAGVEHLSGCPDVRGAQTSGH